MKTERLIRLIEILEKIPESDFDIRFWRRDVGLKTTACAIGHYIMIEKPDDLSLSYAYSFDDIIQYSINNSVIWTVGQMAIAKHFEITERDVENIFCENIFTGGIFHKNKTRQDVITKIKEVIRANRPVNDVKDNNGIS